MPRVPAIAASLVLAAGLMALPAAQAEPKITVKDVEAAFNKVEAVNEQVNQLGVQVKQTQAEIDDISSDIKRVMTTYSAQKAELSGAIVQQQLDAPLGPTANLLTSENPDQFLAGLGAVRALNNTRADALAQFGETSKELRNRRAQLKDRKQDLAEATKEAGAKRAEVRKKYEAAKAELARLDAAEQAKFNQSNTDVTDVDVDPKAGGRAKAALAFAMSQIGDPYVYGGTGPNGWDCSGLVMKSWAAAGVSIPRVVGPQIAAGRAVPMDQLQPGDIVAYGDMSHDGLYLGNGRVVHAPRPGKTVEITSLSGFTRAARVG
ncbi:C40 family peptidase [Aeromicrobium wangtongii]|uniref:NlpC/P60 family protein n=1 Tax=Aeromicrobium wangtongii TaxID=2969247 RepID=A0ABY5MHX2_9ACTN|nr:C40 family peptidase [Aeromicrobium wangtongii]MCD9197523.1 NlpC/P60 family protein [Aeromicrobium wangtongii]UUP15491.1 NlpC/P60 family protein [Aeromicrobium wangtongii]